MKFPPLVRSTLTLGMIFASSAFAQSPDLTLDPTLLSPPPKLDTTLTDNAAIEAQAAQLETQIKSTLATMSAKLSALKVSNLVYSYIIPTQRSQAYSDLLTQIAVFSTPQGIAFKNCVMRQPTITFDDYQKDLTACKAEGAAAYKTIDVQTNLFVNNLMEGLVFHSLQDLIDLQSFLGVPKQEPSMLKLRTWKCRT